MVLPHSPQYVRENVRDLYLSQRECLSFDVEHNMLHSERKSLLVNYQVGSTATLHHKLARAISVKLGHSSEKVEKILPILCIQCRDKAGIYKDEFRKIAITMKRLKLVPPSGGKMRQ